MTFATRMRLYCAFLPTRHLLPRVLAALGYDGIGVEVGVQRAAYSELLLAGSRLSRLILVDPWHGSSDSYDDVANVTQLEQDANLAQARERLEPFRARTEFWQMTSLSAASLVPDASLDFVYLDARHDRESVLADLSVWYAKLRPGGLIAGHDYLDGRLPAGVFGVRSAVDLFFGEKPVIVYSTWAEPMWATWMVAPRGNGELLIRSVRASLNAADRVQRKLRFVATQHRWR